MGYGYHNVDNLIALVKLKCGGNIVVPPRRSTHTKREMTQLRDTYWGLVYVGDVLELLSWLIC
jgi:hypothetical protein